MAACIVCGKDDFKRDDGRRFVAHPHTYHVRCYTRFHEELWKKGNETKTISQIREMVAKEAL